MPAARPNSPAIPRKVNPSRQHNPLSEPRIRANLWIYVVLFLATFFLYFPVRQFDFVSLDDPEDVSANSHVRSGLTPQGIEWALTSGEVANWFPLTRLSHLIDVELFDMRSGSHHLTNVLLHTLATLALFAFLFRATRDRWPSAFVAAMFALHPLHVESVAWIAERKDVLCALFWFATLWAYVRYAERPERRRYVLALLFFSLGLMSKPMIVTLPLVLLLLDVWPLRRLALWPSADTDSKPRPAPIPWSKIVREKIPFFALSAASCAVTYLVQRSGGAVKEVTAYPVWLRVENATVSYMAYIGKTVWPSSLAVFYPYRHDLPLWQAALAGAATLSISALVLSRIRTWPYLAVGWLWYLGTLVPVIGLVQVGGQSRADRYMYLPMVGLAIMLAWGVADALRRLPRLKTAVAVLASAALVWWAVLTGEQIQYWKNSEVLYQHALDVTQQNARVHYLLGLYLVALPGRLPEGMDHFRAAVQISPDDVWSRTHLGIALLRTPGRLTEAIAEFEAALRISPNDVFAHYNLGIALLRTPGRLTDAIAEFEAALRADPNFIEVHRVHNNLGLALLMVPGRLTDAIAEFEAALRTAPNFEEAHANLAGALLRTPGGLPRAVEHYEAAVRLRPDSGEAQHNLGVTLARMPGRLPDAISHLETALRINPNDEASRQALQQLRAARP
jgi:tetratricopeptide (TPR) repeat protein